MSDEREEPIDLEAARAALDPSPEDFARVRAGLQARVDASSGVWSTSVLAGGAVVLLLAFVGTGWMLRSTSVEPVAAEAERAAPVVSPGTSTAPAPTPESSADEPAEVPPASENTPAQVEDPSSVPPPDAPSGQPEARGRISQRASGHPRGASGQTSAGESDAPASESSSASSILAREAARLMRARAALRSGSYGEVLPLTTRPSDGDPLGPERRAVRVLALCGLGRVSAARQVAGRLADEGRQGPAARAIRGSCVGERPTDD